jgi:hypothetical protein
MKNRALSEATWILGTLAAGWLFSLALLPVLSILFAALLLFTLYFFRDPERVPAVSYTQSDAADEQVDV